MAKELETLVIDNFRGYLSWERYGDINSGLANMDNASGYDVFNRPKQLTWVAAPIQIDEVGAVVTDLIVAGKARLESGVVYVYCIGHTGRLYKIQVNDPTTFNPNYDNPVLLATLAINTPTFTRGGSITFFGATERIYIGHDKGVTRIDFDGANEAFVGTQGSYTQTVPRPLVQFVGKLYFGNGTNIGEIDSTTAVTTYTKLSPSFPTNTQVRDLDTSTDGNYLFAVSTELALTSIIVTTPDSSTLTTTNSFLFKWNGIDIGYTSVITYPATAMTSLLTWGDYQYMFGYDIRGGAVYSGNEKILTSSSESLSSDSPLPTGVTTVGGLLLYNTTLPYNDKSTLILMFYGAVSTPEFPNSFYCPLYWEATGTETDIARCPFILAVSNLAQGNPGNGFTDGVFGLPKVYFSTLEYSDTPTTEYKLWKWTPFPVAGQGTLPTGDTAGIYQTQTQLFSKKVKVSEIRIYGEPWVSGVSFTVNLIGSNLDVLAGSEKTFTVGTNLTVGDDFAWYAPQCPPTYAMGFSITNEGETNYVINKAEIDYSAGGK